MIRWQCESFITQCCDRPVLQYHSMFPFQECDNFTESHISSWWNCKSNTILAAEYQWKHVSINCAELY